MILRLLLRYPSGAGQWAVVGLEPQSGIRAGGPHIRGLLEPAERLGESRKWVEREQTAQARVLGNVNI